MATIEEIKKLRDLTGAGVNVVKEALDKSNGEIDLAMKYLREKGIAKAEKRADKDAKNGILGTYIHSNNKFVIIVEVVCETDFAADGDDMKNFGKTLALHIAAMNPRYISVESVDKDELESEKKSYEKDLEGKPEEVKAKIIEGKLEKYYKDMVLLKQQLFTDDKKTVEDLYNETVAKIGEKILITRFFKITLGEDLVSASQV